MSRASRLDKTVEGSRFDRGPETHLSLREGDQHRDQMWRLHVKGSNVWLTPDDLYDVADMLDEALDWQERKEDA